MTEETKKTIKVDDIEYNIDDLTEAQKRALQHIADLNTKFINTNFQLEQLQISQAAFKNILKNSLEAPKEEAQTDSEK
jgi:hypothetical protein|tara:strand:+ start:570 stop:803 length:234 start_codon:yes stop_codon:yes gene_type:complete